MRHKWRWLRTLHQDIIEWRYIEHYLTFLIVGLVFAWEFFSREYDPVILSNAILAVMTLVSFGLLQNRRRNEQPIIIRSNDQANVDYLCEYIDDNKNKIKKARLIQYSGHKISKVVEKLLEMGTRVELLVQHPSAVPSSRGLRSTQLWKMAVFHKTIEHDVRNRQNLAIRYYTVPASVRAVKLDESLLSMGWYTYRGERSDKKTPWLYGHDNATLTADLDRAAARDLVATFDEVFQSLWDNSIPQEQVKLDWARIIQEHNEHDDE